MKESVNDFEYLINYILFIYLLTHLLPNELIDFLISKYLFKKITINKN